MKQNLLLTFLLVLSTLGLSQTQPEYRKKTYVDSLGRYYQQATMPVYLLVATSPDGPAVPLQTKVKEVLYLEGHGVHALKHENSVTLKNDEFMIYADGIVPISTSSFLEAPAFASTSQFYGSGLKVTLSSKDELSGVEEIYHSINGKGYEKYAPVSFSEEGTYTYRYYSVDNTGNAEKPNEKNFIIDLTSPETYHHVINISSENIISVNSTIHLTTSDNLSGVSKTYYKFDKENYKAYMGGNIAFQYLPDGDHTLTYYSVDNVTNKETEKSLDFYLDKTAPITSADVLGDKFLVADKVYFSGRTKLKLTAVDNKSGIKNIMYSINGELFSKYTDPFYLPSKAGYHTVKFYSNDNSENTISDSFHHTVGVIYVDLTGPSISHDFSGPTFIRADTVYVNPKTTVVLSAKDPEAGLKKITYSLNGASSEADYNKPIDLTATSGVQSIDYHGYDNVNNKNSKSAFFIVDTQGPQVSHQFGVSPNNDKYPSYTSLFLSATDNEVGIDQIKYSINGGKDQPYISQIKGFSKNKDYTISVTATDLLGNVSKTEIKFRTDRY